MRMQRAEWRAANPQRRKPQTRREMMQKITCEIRRNLISKLGLENLPAIFEWQVLIPTTPPIECIDIANTKSEVRAKIKKALGSVPPGTVIVKTGRLPRREFIQMKVDHAYQSARDGATEGSAAGEPAEPVGDAVAAGT